MFSYGLSVPERGEEASEETIFEIGSITKTFTGMVMAKLFAEEKVSFLNRQKEKIIIDDRQWHQQWIWEHS